MVTLATENVKQGDRRLLEREGGGGDVNSQVRFISSNVGHRPVVPIWKMLRLSEILKVNKNRRGEWREGRIDRKILKKKKGDRVKKKN